MAWSIGDSLNSLQGMGVFDYLFPFLIIFAVVFAILQKTKIFGDPEQAGKTNITGINAIIAISIGLLSLLNNYVTTFFAVIFPRFGIAISIFLVLMILIGFFYKPDADGKNSSLSWIGWALGIGVVIWAWSEWGVVAGVGDFANFWVDYFPGIILLLALGGIIYWIVRK